MVAASSDHSAALRCAPLVPLGPLLDYPRCRWAWRPQAIQGRGWALSKGLCPAPLGWSWPLGLLSCSAVPAPRAAACTAAAAAPAHTLSRCLCLDPAARSSGGSRFPASSFSPPGLPSALRSPAARAGPLPHPHQPSSPRRAPSRCSPPLTCQLHQPSSLGRFARRKNGRQGRRRRRCCGRSGPRFALSRPNMVRHRHRGRWEALGSAGRESSLACACAGSSVH